MSNPLLCLLEEDEILSEATPTPSSKIGSPSTHPEDVNSITEQTDEAKQGERLQRASSNNNLYREKIIFALQSQEKDQKVFERKKA